MQRSRSASALCSRLPLPLNHRIRQLGAAAPARPICNAGSLWRVWPARLRQSQAARSTIAQRVQRSTSMMDGPWMVLHWYAKVHSISDNDQMLDICTKAVGPAKWIACSRAMLNDSTDR